MTANDWILPWFMLVRIMYIMLNMVGLFLISQQLLPCKLRGGSYQIGHLHLLVRFPLPPVNLTQR